MSDPTHKLHATTDARVWADEFCNLFTVIPRSDEQTPFESDNDELGLMIGWFANAIEVGRDAGRSIDGSMP